ncbi:hypothetical protein DSAG12_00443 [Promethearchaeum syntrophicum]|uniref:SCP2 domain-containing protein n=1 Tax=Promethearchaeum syntrophicum TaxID=2594042 RepID=A0A5B9D714_9ARCH|nr:hypothetical protein [Candidatus Prometheoarchaeum syntrophicum]QEE14630.1 hypothetical protein DSAG12_00443 [Candidatus Prometheoarchaeum syntrophicum]
MMEKNEIENLSNSFKQIVSCAIEEKKEIPKWKKKLQKDLKVSFKLHVYPTEFLYISLILKDGGYTLKNEEIDDYDFQIQAKPEDLMWYSAGNYSLMKMTLTKNDFGHFRWELKKGGRNLFSLLMIANLLLYQ